MRRRNTLALMAASSCGMGLAAAAWAAGARPGFVAVASSVQQAMEEIASAWMRSTGQQLRIVYGSSGNLARQIQQGLPVELFLSADDSFVFHLADAGLTRDRGRVYASGRLALLLAKGSAIQLDAGLRGLKADWHSIRKFAIANPELAPYGRAAREVLQSAGLWDSAQPKLVLGESIAQVTQFVLTGSAQAGFTALSLLTGNTASGVGRHLALPENLHAPLQQRMVLLKRAGPVAAAFHQHLQSAEAKAILRRYGFATD
jgi:molybdate transport system substrate-binding protein